MSFWLKGEKSLLLDDSKIHIFTSDSTLSFFNSWFGDQKKKPKVIITKAWFIIFSAFPPKLVCAQYSLIQRLIMVSIKSSYLCYLISFTTDLQWIVQSSWFYLNICLIHLILSSSLTPPQTKLPSSPSCFTTITPKYSLGFHSCYTQIYSPQRSQ